jgi:phosphoenolpyruvate synthase/pyruvate phosphate dikinase
MQDATYIRWFSDLGRDDVPSVGGKNASLAACRTGVLSQAFW